MTYKHEANGKQFLIVEVPKEVSDRCFYIQDNFLLWTIVHLVYSGYPPEPDHDECENGGTELTAGKYSILFIAEKATEAQAAMVVTSDFISCIHCECGGEQCPGYFGRKLDAHPDCEGVFSHYEYLQSLIRANFTDTNFNHLILEIL